MKITYKQGKIEGKPLELAEEWRNISQLPSPRETRWEAYIDAKFKRIDEKWYKLIVSIEYLLIHQADNAKIAHQKTKHHFMVPAKGTKEEKHVAIQTFIRIALAQAQGAWVMEMEGTVWESHIPQSLVVEDFVTANKAAFLAEWR